MTTYPYPGTITVSLLMADPITRPFDTRAIRPAGGVPLAHLGVTQMLLPTVSQTRSVEGEVTLPLES
uniref:Uncharacterized protein n=1 Tax=Amphimedon queenslandica TaxID=400682 RepID=A0A1X7UDI7_AMPQE